MTKTIIIFILTIFCLSSYGQDKKTKESPFVGLEFYAPQTKKIDSLSQLSTKIQSISNEILKSSMTDFIDKIRFVKGEILELDSEEVDDSIPQTKNRGVFPKYDLFFELVDTSLGIKKFNFRMSFDQYEKMIFFGWPREGYNNRASFISPQLIKAEAIKYADKNKLKAYDCSYELIYNRKLDKICWQILFVQKTEIDKSHYSKAQRTIVIDATSLTILSESTAYGVGTD